MQYSMDKAVTFFRKHLKSKDGVESFIKHLMQVGQQNVHTPFELCREIVGKLCEYRKITDKKIAVLFNIEFLHVLINDFGVKSADVVMFADDDVEVEFCRLQYKMVPGVNLFQIDISESKDKKALFTTEGECKMKFDFVVMNPPYQTGNGNKGAGNIIWDRFVVVAHTALIKDSGVVCAVHPSLWRKPKHKIRRYINPMYLEMHSEKDGLKTFGSNTRYDWYISSKKISESTVIKDQDGVIHTLGIKDWEFIPNCDFDLVKSLIAKDGEERIEIIRSESAYERRKKWMSDKNSPFFKYPCVYMVRTNNEPDLIWSSTNGNGHFGVPKVIYGSGSSGVLIDANGEYGLTQWASGIVANINELPLIAEALNSDKFKQFKKSISMSKLEINTSVLRLFRKDFWKEFLPKSNRLEHVKQTA